MLPKPAKKVKVVPPPPGSPTLSACSDKYNDYKAWSDDDFSDTVSTVSTDSFCSIDSNGSIPTL